MTPKFSIMGCPGHFPYEANDSHDWIVGNELPICRSCGLSKISAHIWGDDDWIRKPIFCSGELAEEEQDA
jgi:hypothetical protein